MGEISSFHELIDVFKEGLIVGSIIVRVGSGGVGFLSNTT